ncbi:DUF397 domain-containing protein [Streptomyces sp. MS06]
MSNAVLVRDSKSPTAANLAFGPEAWAEFLRLASGR